MQDESDGKEPQILERRERLVRAREVMRSLTPKQREKVKVLAANRIGIDQVAAIVTAVASVRSAKRKRMTQLELPLEEGDMAGDLSPILEVARRILTESKQPMHVNDIASEAVRTASNLQLGADEFSKKVAAALAANVKTKQPVFAKVPNKNGGYRKGIYKLKTGRTRSAATPAEPQLPPQAPVSTNFTGKAGEHAVMAELLYRGYNASLMSVDEGIDIVASRNNEYFHIQVKTSALGANGKYAFSIKNNAFVANNGGKTFYIFVMRSNDGSNRFAVFPSTQLEIHRNTGIIGGPNTISIFITPDPKGRTFTMNRGQGIDHFINNFALIK